MNRQIGLGVLVTKRLIDILVSSMGLLVLGLMFPFVALAIKLDSRGPLFYRQERIRWLKSDEDGLEWETFEIIKFRTMTENAEQETGPMFAAEGDQRITRVGLFLRQFKLDEFPQFWQVFTGSMSVVGPRPERPELLNKITDIVPFFEERSRGIKPGITGLAQVSLSYSGGLIEGGALEETLEEDDEFEREYSGVFVQGVAADRTELSNKLLLDVAYSLACENYWEFVRMEFFVLLATPRAMLFRQKR